MRCNFGRRDNGAGWALRHRNRSWIDQERLVWVPVTTDRQPKPASMTPRSALILLLSAVGLAGCGLFGPSKAERRYLEDLRGQLMVSRVAILAEGCVVRKHDDGVLVLRRDSDAIARTARGSLSARMKQHSAQFHAPDHRLLCSGLTADADAIAVVDSLDSPIERVEDLPLAEGAQKWLDQSSSLAEATAAVVRACGQISRNRHKPSMAWPYPKYTAISTELLSELREQLQADYLVVVQASGIDVSLGQSLGQALVTGLASSLLTNGAFIISTFDRDGYGYTVGLVDLKTGHLLWSNGETELVGKPRASSFNRNWAITALDPLLPPPKRRRH